jgi:hypothetical protein
MLIGSDSLVNSLILVCLGYAALLPFCVVDFLGYYCCFLFGIDIAACPFCLLPF